MDLGHRDTPQPVGGANPAVRSRFPFGASKPTPSIGRLADRWMVASHVLFGKTGACLCSGPFNSSGLYSVERLHQTGWERLRCNMGQRDIAVDGAEELAAFANKDWNMCHNHIGN